MDKFPLLWAGKSTGDLTTEQEALYTWFSARCRLPGEGIWCAWAIGEQGELRLGVLEPSGDQAAIRRRFSRRMTEPLGRLLRGEIRPATGGGTAWERAPEPDRLFHTPWLRRQLRGQREVLTRREKGRRYLAFPYDRKKPFPLPALFCLACLRRIDQVDYVVFAFDEREQPLFP